VTGAASCSADPADIVDALAYALLYDGKRRIA